MFKSKQSQQSISYPQNVNLVDGYIKLPVIRLVFGKQDRKFNGQIKTVTVFLNSNYKYFFSVLVDNNEKISPVSFFDKAVGIDLELTNFCIIANSSKFYHPCPES